VSMPNSAARAWSSGFFLDLRVFDIFLSALKMERYQCARRDGEGNYLGDDKAGLFLMCVCV